MPAGVDVTPKGEPLSSTDDPVSVPHGPKSYGEGKAARKRVQKEASVDIKGAALVAVAGQPDGSGDNKNGSVPEGLESECPENDAGGKAGSTRSAQRRLAQVRILCVSSFSASPCCGARSDVDATKCSCE